MPVSRKAQSAIEYVLVLGLITAVFVSMQVYFRRSVQAKIKDMTDAMLPAGTVSGDVAQLSRVNPIIPLLDPDPVTGQTSEYSTSALNISDSKTTQARVYGNALIHETQGSSGSHMFLAQPDPSKEASGGGSPPEPPGGGS